jgi:DNA transformation protein and related proteins
MAARDEYLQYVLEQLAGLSSVSSRRMFGAFGLYCDTQFFALISDDTLYFKVGDATRGDYEARGMARFRPYRDKPEWSMSYYEVPADVLEDSEELVAWARRAVDAALSSEKEKKATAARAKARKTGARGKTKAKVPARAKAKSPRAVAAEVKTKPGKSRGRAKAKRRAARSPAATSGD